MRGYSRLIYLDNNATTRPSEEVVRAVANCMRQQYVNPASALAQYASSENAWLTAATSMCLLLNAEEPGCFTFTSGATESNNWFVAALASSKPGDLILTSGMEHPSVSEPLLELRSKLGIEVVEVPTERSGRIDLKAFESLASDRTVAISVMAANNVTGVIQPLAELGCITRERRSFVPVQMQPRRWEKCEWTYTRRISREVDLLSFLHKFHGQGIGGLCSVQEFQSLRSLLWEEARGTSLRSGGEQPSSGRRCGCRCPVDKDRLAEDEGHEG